MYALLCIGKNNTSVHTLDMTRNARHRPAAYTQLADVITVQLQSAERDSALKLQGQDFWVLSKVEHPYTLTLKDNLYCIPRVLMLYFCTDLL